MLDRINLVEFNIFLTFNVTQEEFTNSLALVGHGTVTVLVGIDEIYCSWTVVVILYQLERKLLSSRAKASFYRRVYIKILNLWSRYVCRDTDRMTSRTHTC